MEGAPKRRAGTWVLCVCDVYRSTQRGVPAARAGATRGGAKATRTNTRRAPRQIRVASLVVSVLASVWPAADCVALFPALAFSGSAPVAPRRPASCLQASLSSSAVSGRPALLPLSAAWGGRRVRDAATPCSMVLSSNSRRLMGDKNDTSVVGAELEKVELSAVEIWRLMVPTDKKLQFRVVVSLVLLVLCRLANIMVPLTFKQAIDILTQIQTGVGGAAAAAAVSANAALLHAAMSTVGMFFVWKLTQGLGEIARQYLWVAVQSDLKRRISQRLLEHLHSLSFRFHVSSKSGQTLQIMDKGTSALESLMEILPFRLFPALCDVILVCAVFLTLNKPAIAAIAGGTIACYSVITYVLTKWRTKFWREMVMSEITYKGRAVESLQNVETVKYFAAERHEVQEYCSLISSWQAKKQRSERTLAVLNTCQKLIICAGLTAVMYVSVGSVAAGSMTVGDLVMTTTYMEQLYTPLTWLGTIYRMTEDSLVDMERMFKLLHLQPEVRDRPGAQALNVSEAAIEFDNVSFSYDGGATPVLRNISFRVGAGQTLALVGSSGGGKSTIGRLLMRLYDVEDGAVRVDGVDIRNVTQRSLRAAVGVVPQETTLFNNLLDYNIRYGAMAVDQSPDMTEVEAAAIEAQLHQRVMNWADGYKTGVGEKGMRLSGGEKQRVGIARAFIKNPRIVLLDEATSALDSQTEQQIQSALTRACEGRTAIVIAHRLSTVVKADKIAVLKQGHLVEIGSHHELLAQRGEYYKMWQRQAQSSTVARAIDPALASIPPPTPLPASVKGPVRLSSTGDSLSDGTTWSKGGGDRGAAGEVGVGTAAFAAGSSNTTTTKL